MEAVVRARFERIEAILDAIAKRQDAADKRYDRADKRQDRADKRQDRLDKQMQVAATRQDRFDRQLQATARLVAEGIKIVRGLARDTRELQRSQKAFLDSLRHGTNGRSTGKV